MSPKIKRGDIVDVKITGIQPYGAFASLPDNSTGLIHISEISDKFVKSIDSFVKVGLNKVQKFGFFGGLWEKSGNKWGVTGSNSRHLHGLLVRFSSL